jgi:hypothetical protein
VSLADACSSAIALEAAIAAWTDLPAIAALAREIAARCRAAGAPALADVAEAIARAMDHTRAGEIEPAHAQWMSASTAWSVRDALERARRGEAVPPAALAAARYELETLFPVPATGALPTIGAAPAIVPASALTAKR